MIALRCTGQPAYWTCQGQRHEDVREVSISLSLMQTHCQEASRMTIAVESVVRNTSPSRFCLSFSARSRPVYTPTAHHARLKQLHGPIYTVDTLMSLRAAAVVRRHPLVLLLILAVVSSSLYIYRDQHAGTPGSSSHHHAFDFSNSMAHFNFSDHFARLQHAHWLASSGYGENVTIEPATSKSASDSGTATRRILKPEEAFKEQDGLLYLSDMARPGADPSNKVEHPILYLIRQAKKEWQKKLDSQSTDLATAVKTYKKKYGRNPPKGFDKW